MISQKELVGARIKSLRGARGMTQERLAEVMDINSKYLSNIERGKENPTLDMFIKLANALGVEMWEIFDFGHEVNIKELREAMSKLLKESDEKKLRMAVKIMRAVAR